MSRGGDAERTGELGDLNEAQIPRLGDPLPAGEYLGDDEFADGHGYGGEDGHGYGAMRGGPTGGVAAARRGAANAVHDGR